MAPNERKILWADDEIELLRPHILFLEEKGYRVTPVSNGDDAVASAAREKFDAVLLDESMPGRGLGPSSDQAIRPSGVLVTKNEGRIAHGRAIGRRISDYLKTGPAGQLFLALKRLLEAIKPRDQLARDYVAELARRAEAAGRRLAPLDRDYAGAVGRETDPPATGFAERTDQARAERRSANASSGV
jgi:CheY-like chemotaxis protein